jgi:hypothetical protein
VYRSERRHTIDLGADAHRCAEQPGNIPCTSRARTPRPACSRLRCLHAPEEMMRSGSAAFPAAKRAVKYASTGSTAHAEETSRGVVLALTRRDVGRSRVAAHRGDDPQPVYGTSGNEARDPVSVPGLFERRFLVSRDSPMNARRIVAGRISNRLTLYTGDPTVRLFPVALLTGIDVMAFGLSIRRQFDGGRSTSTRPADPTTDLDTRIVRA